MNKHAWNARRVAFGGIVSALSLIFMLLSAMLPFAEYTCPALAGILLATLVIDFGKRTAWLAYGSVAVLSLLTISNKESAMMFVFLLGYYPILKASIERIQARALEWGVKILLFNASVLAAYWLMANALGMAQVLDNAQIGGISLQASLLLLLAAGNFVFVLYDLALSRLIVLYCQRIRPQLQRILK